MKHFGTITLILMLTLGAAAQLGAAEGLVETVAKGCEAEITTYCKDVTPGEGRILACLYAYPNMFVADGSVVPANLGVNPSLTITALSEYIMSQVPGKS